MEKKNEIQKTERTHTRRVFVPRTDIVETQDAILLFADLPGVIDRTLDVTLERNVLSVKGESRYEAPSDQKLAYSEFGEGQFERVFTLSEEIDRSGIEASVKNGLLRLHLPKTKESAPKKIAVRSN
jgi:HSP20 family protein